MWTTRQAPDPRPRPGSRKARALDRLSNAPLNFDPSDLGEEGKGAHWNYDESLQALPSEAPGPPARDGSWQVASALMRGYGFADPSMVRGHYDPDAPLEGRTLLLVVRFWGLRFFVGCRVADVYERTEAIGGARAHVWGWSYRTLEGHFEQGELHWAVLKDLDTGEVSFRIHSWSRRAPGGNPIARMGFRLFGRRQQLRFYERTCERMLRLTEEGLDQARR